MSACRGCGSSSLEMFLDLGRMPLAGGFLSGRAAAEKEVLYPLPVHVCRECSLVQIVDPVDPEILFQDYSFASSTVAPLVNHFEAYAAWLVERYRPASVVEFGCNDGILVKPLAARGVRAVGVDPSKNITALAREKGLDVVTGYFDRALARELEGRVGKVDLVTGSNAFAHNAEPGRILEAARSLLNPKGLLCLEVMYAGDLLEQMQWDTLYHEHLTFYSLGTLATLLGRNGFKLIHAERIPMHGGSLRIAATPDQGAEASAGMRAVEEYENRMKLNDPATWKGFGERVQRKIDVVRDTLKRLSRNARIWGYGAAGKATLWVNACKLDYLEAMVDASPLRAGKLMPGTHTPIVFPQELRRNPPEYILVTAWNYLDNIRRNESWYQGIWITPLPEMRFH
jgi:SAM-dependent methyltransferase